MAVIPGFLCYIFV